MYTNPGSGLFFIQVLAATVLTLVYRFRRLLSLRFTAERDGRPNCNK